MNATQIAALGEITRQVIAKAVAPLVQRIDELEKLQAKDAEKMMNAIQDMAKSIPAPYDDTTLRADIAKMIPAAYDDSKLREDFSSMLKKQEEQINTVQKMAADQPAPQNGIDGRDALHLEVLPAIDEAKSYPRGTYAKHAGGLWRSFEQTSGMRGWECIVNGVKSVDARWDGKTLVEITTLSDGTVSEARKFFPVAVYKGVFDGGEYEQGDTATWAGSLWHCNKTGTKAKPGDGSSDWTLAVKKGRDGREVVKTERKQQPVQINNEENNDSI